MAGRDGIAKKHSLFPWLGFASLPANTASQNGAWVDLAQYNAAEIYILAGGWTDGTHAFTIQEAPDVAGAPGTPNAVAATDLGILETSNGVVNTLPNVYSASGSQPASIVSSATALNQRVTYHGAQRWLRVISTVATATVGAKYFALIVPSEPRVIPAPV